MHRIHDRNLRGKARTGWLDTQHTFSFGSFHDPDRMGLHSLRVINEDRIIPGAGFAEHGHADMEIVTYVISGALAHKDSLGTGSIIRPGEIQRMTAGTGIRHSEMNASNEDPVHLLQIWIHPSQAGLEPSYEQVTLAEDVGHQGFTPIAGPDVGEGGVTLHQDARILLAKPEEGETLHIDVREGRAAFVQMVKGEMSVDGETLRAGDGVEIDHAAKFDLTAEVDSEILLFDLG